MIRTVGSSTYIICYICHRIYSGFQKKAELRDRHGAKYTAKEELEIRFTKIGRTLKQQ